MTSLDEILKRASAGPKALSHGELVRLVSLTDPGESAVFYSPDSPELLCGGIIQ